MLTAVLVAVAVLPLVMAPEASGALMCDGKVVTIQGTSGPDELWGTPGADVIAGLGGDDVIYGEAGPDSICGGDGDDWIDGGDGSNRIRGNAGDDRLFGGSGFDAIWGGWGDDVIEAWIGPGSLLYGGAGRDQISVWQVGPGDNHQINGQAGRDLLDLRFAAVPAPATGVCVELNMPAPNLKPCQVVVDVWTSPTPGATVYRQPTGLGSGFVTSIEKVYGTVGDDFLVGDDRSNRLRGMAGDDYLDGRGGNDRLLAGFGDDLLMGGWGNDRLVGGPGTDALNGEGGTDICRKGEVLEDCEA